MQIGNEIITFGNVHWVGVFMWMLVVLSFVCFVLGIKKRSGWLMFLSALTAFPMALFLYGAKNWVRTAILVPVMEIIVALVFWFLPGNRF